MHVFLFGFLSKCNVSVLCCGLTKTCIWPMWFYVLVFIIDVEKSGEHEGGEEERSHDFVHSVGEVNANSAVSRLLVCIWLCLIVS